MLQEDLDDLTTEINGAKEGWLELRKDYRAKFGTLPDEADDRVLRAEAFGRFAWAVGDLADEAGWSDGLLNELVEHAVHKVGCDVRACTCGLWDLLRAVKDRREGRER